MLELVGVQKAFAGRTVLHDIDLRVQEGEIVCLLGASGSGKSTLLRIIAGLETPDDGTLTWRGQALQSVPVHQRDFGLVFQDFALFPHMTVGENILFGLKMHNADAALKRARLAEILALVGLVGFERRSVTALSGGERQRVALGRALAPRPQLLMLDEPLGALDAALRESLVTQLREIIKQVGLTAVYVTHDQPEAFAIADAVAVMHEGRIIQVDTPTALYYTPRYVSVARFLGLPNLLEVERYEQGQAYTALGRFDMPRAASYMLLHPHAFQLATDGVLHAEIIARVFLGGVYRMRVRTSTGHTLTVHLTRGAGTVPNVGEWVGFNILDWGRIPVDED